jgi:hypothetical protein
MHVVEKPEDLGRPVVEVAPVALEWIEAPDVDLREVHRRVAVDDPVGQRPPGSTTRLEADRVEPGRHPVATELGCLAEDVPIVGRE